MSYQALYRKYRPSNFSNVVGQDVVVEVLINSIKSNHISHAYLFAGPRGTGKTSIAKIFAKAVNCQNFTNDICDGCQNCEFLKTNDSDVIEIDAASNNGVEEIRSIRDNVKLLPTFCKFKVYIIDEVHMLSTGAFNALLKTLEEPPKHVIFILATTEPNKIPLTILSRCQRFDFNKIDNFSLINRLNFVLQNEEKKLPEDIINHIADISDGGLRDAINLLDQVLSISSDSLSIEDIDKLSGKVSKQVVFNLFDYIINNDYKNLLDFINNISLEGKSYNDIINNMLIFVRDYSINKEVSDYFDLNYSSQLLKYDFSSTILINISKILNELLTEIKNSNNQKLLFEIYMMHLIQVINNKNEEIKSVNIENKVVNTKDKMEATILNNLQDSDIIDDTMEEKDEIVQSENKEDLIVNSSMEKLKSIRVNNVLFGANKDILNRVVADYDRINDFISNKVYNSLSALLNEGKIVVASDSYLLFSFDEESFVNVFDINYKQIEVFLNEIYDKIFKVVAITSKEWDNTRNEFIKNKKNNIPYVFIDENEVKLEVSENNFSKLENSALDIFGEDTVSVK